MRSHHRGGWRTSGSRVFRKSEIEVERGIKVNSKMETNVPNVYAAGDVTGLSGIWPNAMKQGQTAARNMCGVGTEYTDTFAAKNTINFFRTGYSFASEGSDRKKGMRSLSRKTETYIAV